MIAASGIARAREYVPLYDMLCEIVTEIKDDPEADREMKVLARRGRKVLDEAKERVAAAENGNDGIQRAQCLRASDRSVRDVRITAKLVKGQVIVACKRAGVIFSFPRAVWPADAIKQILWIERLTPWWDMTSVDWEPACQRARESCRAAINKLTP